ncbi:MAG TPA: phosphatidylglycerophosphatase A [Candidatus Cloacimonetes bacterium]|nr:phosphatidylglycerophosphatase A [Candidatus Cloacimonadota bacterium]
MNKKKLSVILSSVFWLGFIPFAPGTFGSLAAFGLYLILPGMLFEGSYRYIMTLAVMLLALIFVPIVRKAEKALGDDAPQIVIDEVFGYLVAVLFLPKTLMIGIWAFILFRVFDIGKPFPINKSQSIGKGFGVMIDDLLAGLYANILLQFLTLIKPQFFGI